MLAVLQALVYVMAVGVIVGLPFVAGVGWGRNVERSRRQRREVRDALDGLKRIHANAGRVPAKW